MPGLDVRAEVLKRRLLYLQRHLRRRPQERGRIFEIRQQLTPNQQDAPGGPIGLVIKDLRQLHGNLTAGLELTMDGETNLDLCAEPAETIRRRINLMAQQFYLEQNVIKRQTIRGTPEVGRLEGVGTASALGETGRKLIRTINAGGLWTGFHSMKTGKEQESVCALCGQDLPSTEAALKHLFWRCPCTTHCREEA